MSRTWTKIECICIPITFCRFPLLPTLRMKNKLLHPRMLLAILVYHLTSCYVPEPLGEFDFAWTVVVLFRLLNVEQIDKTENKKKT